jgi:flagellar hook-associated protein 3 FlgL
MRISTTQIYSQGLKAFGDQQTKLAKLQEQISTGQKLTKPSDDPAASARALELEQIVSLHEQYQVNINNAENRLDLEEGVADGMENVLLRVRELTLQGNNATQDDVSRSSIAYEIDQLYDQMLSLANTVDSNGDYLFGGYQNQNQPFTQTVTGSISHVTFNGDPGTMSTQISQSRQMNIDTEGRKLFMQIPSANAINELAAASNAGSIVMAPGHVYDSANYVPDTYTISFDTVTSVPDTTYSIVNSSGTTVASGVYQDGEQVDFMGIRTSFSGQPANGDQFTVSPGQYQDIFEIISTLSESLKNGSSGVTTPGSYTFGAPVTVFDYSTDSASFEVDGNLINLNADYTDLAGVTAAIQTQLDTAVGSGVYNVTQNGSTISIANVTTGTASTAPIVNNFNGDVDANGTPATSGTTTTAAISVTDYSGGADVSFDVDGFAVVLDADYTNLAGVTGEIQSDLDATAGPGVYNVTDNGTTITITKLATGAASTAPVIANAGGAGSNQAEFTTTVTTNGVDALNTVADFVSGGQTINGSGGVNIHNNLAQTLTDLDTSFNRVLEARTNIGGRLNALDTQRQDNEAFIISTNKTLGTLRDTDMAEAISQLTLEQTILDAAQAVFSRITSSSLFNYLR